MFELLILFCLSFLFFLLLWVSFWRKKKLLWHGRRRFSVKIHIWNSLSRVLKQKYAQRANMSFYLMFLCRVWSKFIYCFYAFHTKRWKILTIIYLPSMRSTYAGATQAVTWTSVNSTATWVAQQDQYLRKLFCLRDFTSEGKLFQFINGTSFFCYKKIILNQRQKTSFFYLWN